ncbi:MAG: ThiF family adenylyltransferase [Pirellulales bacterium]|nr:ThiF family adenylyltransferase [Pirellulales bacterium]
MEDEHLDAGGLIIATDTLELPRSRELAAAMETGRLAFVTHIECRRGSGDDGDVRETIVFDVEVERPQRCMHDIRRIERIAVEFAAADNWYPEVISLRADFPQVPHLNLRDEEFPRSLCLYDQSWSEIALRWTPTGFIERIRTWLAETAKGSLHQTDQPLEPVLAGTGLSIILPPDLFASWDDQDAKQLQVGTATPEDNCRVFSTHPDPRAGGLSVTAVCLMAKPRQHAAIRRRPKTLAELHDLLAIDGTDLRQQLRSQLEAVDEEHRWKRKLLIVIAFPLSRDADLTVEITDVWAFFTASSVAEVGIAIGVWMKMPGDQQLGTVMGEMLEATGSEIKIDVIAPQFGLSREAAAAASGTLADPCRTVAIGAGALGSQVIHLLAQSGFGSWTIVDEDILAPHNVARHALSPMWIGWSKATALAQEVSEFYPTDVSPTPIVDDFMRASVRDEKLKEAVDSSELILDMSASIPVARHVAHDLNCNARRASLFLNPSGSDLVMLVEDTARAVPLDCLEMQYYREVAFNESLSKHLAPPAGRIRYARSCRDVSSTIPANLVGMHAAIAADELRNANRSGSAKAIIWQASETPMRVQPTEIAVHDVDRTQVGEWTLVVTAHAVGRLGELRAAKLPNETGGVLIGGYDLSRKIVYVVDMPNRKPCRNVLSQQGF